MWTAFELMFEQLVKGSHMFATFYVNWFCSQRIYYFYNISKDLSFWCKNLSFSATFFKYFFQASWHRSQDQGGAGLHKCCNHVSNAEYANRNKFLSCFPDYCQISQEPAGFRQRNLNILTKFDMWTVIKHCLKTFQNSISYGEMFSKNSRLPYVSMSG